MSLFSKIDTEWTLKAVVVFCIYSIKILLFGVGDAGLRPDDLLILFAIVLLLLKGELFRIRWSKPFKAYAAFVGIGVISSLWNAFQGRVNLLYSFLFDARLVEYMVFYFIGYFIAKQGKNVDRIISVYFYLLLIVVPLQMLRILPVFTLFGWERAVANTNGPYEFAIVASFLLCYMGYRNKNALNGFLSVVLVVLAASRVTFIGIVVSLYSFILRLGRRSLNAAVIAGSVVLCSLGLGVLYMASAPALADSDIMLLSRLGSAEGSNSISTFLAVYPGAPVYSNSQDYLEGTFDHTCDFQRCLGEGDTSATIRMYRWSALIKSTLASGDSILIGLGPSFASTAVDGYYVRELAECGVLGLGAFLWSMVSFWKGRSKAHWPFREYVLIVLISGVFIDIFTSYKTMILLWLWHGLNEGQDVHDAEMVKQKQLGEQPDRVLAPVVS